MNVLTFNSAWLSIIKGYDGLGPNVSNGIAKAYQGEGDRPADPHARWPFTCGFGHLMSANEEAHGVKVGDQLIDAVNTGLSFAQCDTLLAQDLAPRIQTVKDSFNTINDQEFGAFLDLLFNSGPQGLIQTPGTRHREGNKHAAAKGMLLYRNANGIPLLGLWRRRLTDAIYYLGGPVIVANSIASENDAKTALSNLLGEPVVRPMGLH